MNKPGVNQKGNRFLPHQLHSNTHIFSILLMQYLMVKLMQVKLGIKESDQSVNLPCTVDEDDAHSKLLIDLIVILRSI